MKHRRKLKRCHIGGLVILNTEIEAKIVLARRVWADKGEKRYFPCGNHWHLTAEEADPGRNKESA